jgi:hypothetical protein
MQTRHLPQQVFKVTKEDFSKFPGWKKISKRKAAGLF